MVQAPIPRVLLLQSLWSLPKEIPCPRGEMGPWIRKEGKDRKIGRDRKGKHFLKLGKLQRSGEKEKRVEKEKN